MLSQFFNAIEILFDFCVDFLLLMKRVFIYHINSNKSGLFNHCVNTFSDQIYSSNLKKQYDSTYLSLTTYPSVKSFFFVFLFM